MAILLAMLSTISIASGEFLAGGVTKRTRANEVTSAMFVAGVAMTAVVALVWPGDPTQRDLIFGALAGLANGTGILLLYVAYSRGSLRSAAPAAAVTMSSVPIAWDVVVTGTNPSTLSWVGIVLGVAAIALSSYERGEVEDDRYGLPIAMLAGAIFGVLLIFLGEIGDDAGGTPLFVQRASALALAVIVTRATGPRILPGRRADRATSFVLGLFATTAIVLFVLALQAGGSLAVVSVIGSQYAGVAVVLGVLLRGQRMWWWQAVGLAGASLAVALISIG
ncbi:MAG: EamA family transporter [Acidimicrobiales bacterium]